MNKQGKSLMIMVLQPNEYMIDIEYPFDHIYEVHKKRQKQYDVLIFQTIRSILNNKNKNNLQMIIKIQDEWIEDYIETYPTFAVTDIRILQDARLIRFGPHTLICTKGNPDKTIILQEYRMLGWMLYHINCYTARDFIVHLQSVKYFIMMMIGLDFFQHVQKHIHNSKLKEVQELQSLIDNCSFEKNVVVHHDIYGSTQQCSQEEIEKIESSIIVYEDWKNLHKDIKQF